MPPSRHLASLLPILPLGLLVLAGPLALDPGSVQPFGFAKQAVVSAAAIGMLLCWAVAAWLDAGSVHGPGRRLLGGLSLLLAMLLASAALAYNKHEALDEANRLFLLMALFGAAAHVRWDARALRILLALALVPAAWIAFTVVLEYAGRLEVLGVRAVFYRKEQRVIAFFGHNNVVAQYLAVAACWAGVQLWLAASRLRRALLLGCQSLILAGLFFTFSRSGWLSACLGLSLAALLLRRRLPAVPRRWLWGAALGSLALAAALVLAVKACSPAPGSPGFVASQWKEAGIFHHVSSGRFRMWEATLRMIADNPLAGVGAGNYWVLYGRYDPARWDFVRFAHNDYLQLAAEFGLPGVLVLALLAWGGLRWLKAQAAGVAPASEGAACAIILAGGLCAALSDAALSYDFYQPVSSAFLAGGGGVLVGLLRRSPGAAPWSGFAKATAAAALLFLGISEGMLHVRAWRADRAHAAAEGLLAGGDLAQAVRHAAEAARLRPGFAAYENGLAVLHHRAGHRGAALRQYQAAAALTPYELNNYLGILGILKGAGDEDELLRWYPAALAAAPQRLDLRNEYAYLLFEKGLYESARRQYELILERRPGDPLALLNLASACLKLSDPRRALLLYQRLVEMQPGTLAGPGGARDAGEDIMNGMAVALDALGETDQAYALLERYRAHHPPEIASYLTEIDIARRRQDAARVRAAAAEARRIDPAAPLPPGIEAPLE